MMVAGYGSSGAALWAVGWWDMAFRLLSLGRRVMGYGAWGDRIWEPATGEAQSCRLWDKKAVYGRDSDMNP